MDENNKNKFWPTFDKNRWTPKRIIPSVIFLLVFLFDRFFVRTIALSPLEFNISLGVGCILMLLCVVWIFKQRDQINSTAMRIEVVIMMVIVFFVTFGHYLHFF